MILVTQFASGKWYRSAHMRTLDRRAAAKAKTNTENLLQQRETSIFDFQLSTLF